MRASCYFRQPFLLNRKIEMRKIRYGSKKFCNYRKMLKQRLEAIENE